MTGLWRHRDRIAVNEDTTVDEVGPDGAVCQKIRGHIGDHGGMDSRGAWRDWLGGDS